MMDRRVFLTTVAGLLAAPLAAEAQQAGKMYRVGHLLLLPRERVAPLVEALEQGLRDLGYVEGRNMILEHRQADGRPERFAEFAAELVRLKVDVIVAGSNQAIAAAKQATTTIPIVMVYGLDPVGMGFVTSLRRPGGNITGGSFDVSPELYAKNLELLRECVPRASRIAFLWNPGQPGATAYKNATEHAARQVGVRLRSVELRAPTELESAFASMAKDRAEGVLTFAEPLTYAGRERIATLAARYRLAAAAPPREFAEAGGLISYGPNLPDFWRRAAVYIDKILKGANPADLPVEQPTKFDLVINLKTAKALGLTIPPSLLARADQVIHP